MSRTKSSSRISSTSSWFCRSAAKTDIVSSSVFLFLSFSSFVCFFLFSVVVVQEVSPVLFVFLSFSAPPSGIFVAAAGSMLPATLTSNLRFFSFSFSFSLSLLCSRLGLVCRVRVPRSRCFCSASALVRSLQVAVLVEPIATTSDNTTTLGI